MKTRTITAKLGVRVCAMILVTAVLALTTLVGATPARADSPSKLLLVLDSSGSMAEKAGDGKTRMEAAKAALTSVVGSLAADANVGLRVYGATVFDKSAGNACADSQLVVPIGTNNKPALTKAISGFKPYGETPISYSLEQAGKDVGPTGQRSIVLISDGEETCTTDPCVAAQKLANQGIDVRIDVVGFDVSGKAKTQLQCVAKVGRGQYTDVKDTKQLTEQLNLAKKRASEPFELSGTPVTGSADPASAPPITAATWSDTMPAPGQTKYYRLDRTMDRSTFWAGLTMAPTMPDKAFAFSVMRIRPQGEDYPTCGSSYPYAWTSSGRTAGMMTGRTTSAGRGVDSIDECEKAQLVLSIKADDGDDSPDLSKQKFQLSVFEEAPASNTASLPKAVSDDEKLPWTPMKAGKATKVAAATSLTKAPTVQPGTHSFDIVPGEFRVLKVPVSWGQRLQAMLSTGALPQYKQSDANDKIELKVLAPLGGEANARFDAKAPYRDSDLMWRTGSQLGTGTREVRYANRNSSDDSTVAAGLAGEFYVVVTLSKEPTSPANAIPITLTLATIGAAGTGAPTYEEPTQPQGSASPTPSDEPTSEASQDPTSQASKADPSTSTGASVPPDEQKTSGRGKNWGLIGGLTVFGLLLGGFSVWFANRTRRR